MFLQIKGPTARTNSITGGRSEMNMLALFSDQLFPTWIPRMSLGTHGSLFHAKRDSYATVPIKAPNCDMLIQKPLALAVVCRFIGY